jgi:hypothetical protein
MGLEIFKNGVSNANKGRKFRTFHYLFCNVLKKRDSSFSILNVYHSLASNIRIHI